MVPHRLARRKARIGIVTFVRLQRLVQALAILLLARPRLLGTRLLARGVYLYRVKVRGTDTAGAAVTAESGFEKLVLLK